MHQTRLGNTDITTSILGLGTVKIGRNTAVKYPSSFNIPDDQQVLACLSTAAECGINLIDTAPAYGNSEERLGNLLPRINHDWVVCTKVGEIFDKNTGLSTYNFSPEHITQSVEHSLQKLQREVLDIVLIHSDGKDLEIIEKHGALDTLNQLKQKGLIRATGMSTKTIDGGILAASHSDVVMVTFNPNHQEEKPVIEYAHKHNTGIFIKKALASGHVASEDGSDGVQKSFELIFQQPGVNSVILGSINPGHIRSNAGKAIKAFKQNN